ncbi:Glutathione S-transferase omega-1 [Halocaridina rubra]|uniref:Glutathione-dependent dehydroascorbate reductase n=1 Tax=Halocaridina rubra TaxID=373956 RepID=A0AAN8XGN1_HALRR
MRKGLSQLSKMSLLHLKTGSVCPPTTPGLLRCYNMKYCPYAQRTLLVLHAKNIKHEVVNINLMEKPEWFFEKNPLAKVPTLELDGKLMYESLVTCDYLDEVYPEPPLYPRDPWQKGRERCLIELFGKVISSMYKTYRAYAKEDKEEMAETFNEVVNGLAPFEAELKIRGTKFFGGNTPGMLDYILWPFGERFPVVEISARKMLPQTELPLLKSWMQNMKEDRAVKAVYIPPEIHKMYLEDSLSGKPGYDKNYSALLASKV